MAVKSPPTGTYCWRAQGDRFHDLALAPVAPRIVDARRAGMLQNDLGRGLPRHFWRYGAPMVLIVVMARLRHRLLALRPRAPSCRRLARNCPYVREHPATLYGFIRTIANDHCLIKIVKVSTRRTDAKPAVARDMVASVSIDLVTIA